MLRKIGGWNFSHFSQLPKKQPQSHAHVCGIKEYQTSLVDFYSGCHESFFLLHTMFIRLAEHSRRYCSDFYP